MQLGGIGTRAPPRARAHARGNERDPDGNDGFPFMTGCLMLLRTLLLCMVGTAGGNSTRPLPAHR